MRLQLCLTEGNGPEQPPRVPLPTYDLVDVDQTNDVALVDVPAADLPPEAIYRDVLTATRWERADMPPALLGMAVEAWHAHLDERYAEHAGRFRPIPL